jgi:hypothetical protein
LGKQALERVQAVSLASATCLASVPCTRHTALLRDAVEAGTVVKGVTTATLKVSCSPDELRHLGLKTHLGTVLCTVVLEATRLADGSALLVGHVVSRGVRARQGAAGDVLDTADETVRGFFRGGGRIGVDVDLDSVLSVTARIACCLFVAEERELTRLDRLQ